MRAAAPRVASLLDRRDGIHVRIAYGSLIDEPALRLTAHIFAARRAPGREILGDLSPAA